MPVTAHPPTHKSTTNMQPAPNPSQARQDAFINKAMDTALTAYQEKMGASATQPIPRASCYLSTGWVLLYGMEGQLAAVSPAGVVFDDVNGKPL